MDNMNPQNPNPTPVQPVQASTGTTGTEAGQNRTLFGVLAYLGPLVIISLLVAKNDSFVKFHIKQGLVLFVIEIIVWILSSIGWQLWMLWYLINLGTLVFSIIGIVNVVQNKQQELPFIGQFSKHFTF
jgi:uncharacterized membrane protein